MLDKTGKEHQGTPRAGKPAYTLESVEAALTAVNDGMSINSAARAFGVPKTTLRDKLARRRPIISTIGHPTVLTAAEESVLVEYICLMHKIGFPVTRKDIANEVYTILQDDGRSTPFKDGVPGPDWVRGFMKRHSERIADRTPQSLGLQRAIITIDVIKSWFKCFERYLRNDVDQGHEIIRNPQRIFNADESGFPLEVKSGKVLAPKGAKSVYSITSGSKQQITVMACFNAVGQYTPPMILYPGQRLRDVGMSHFPEAMYGVSDNGWMTTTLFCQWLVHFSNFVDVNGIQRPVSLVLDGHSTHISLEASTFCSENRIVLYSLPPNSTHVLQPCDIALFRPMKDTWKDEVKQWQRKSENLGHTLTKNRFSEIFCDVYYKCATISTAVNGFRRAGLFPLGVDSIDKSKIVPQSVETPMVFIIAAKGSIPKADLQPTSKVEAAETKQDFMASMSLTENISNIPALEDNGTKGNTTTHIQPTHSTQTCTFAPPLSTTITVIKTDSPQTHVSKSFELLHVPDIKPKTSSKQLRSKLPKALSGHEAIRMMKERVEEKERQEHEKEQRKEEREMKKRKRTEEQEKKKEEKEKKMKAEKVKKGQTMKPKSKRRGQKRTTKETGLDTRSERSIEVVSIDSNASDDPSRRFVAEFCGRCNKSTGETHSWICCSECFSWWHKKCTLISGILKMSEQQIQKFNFVCEKCPNPTHRGV